MKEEKVYWLSNVVIPSNPIEFDEKICNGCNICVDTCQVDVFLPNQEKGRAPILAYPDECWYCGCCVMYCPNGDKGAIYLRHPLTQKVRWKRKTTGEHFRIGMKNAPPPVLRPPA